MTKFRYRKNAFVYSLILQPSIKSPIILGTEGKVKGFTHGMYLQMALNLGEKTIKKKQIIA